MQVGDASGIQSPLSFGGFGALTRHMGRLRGAITEALQVRSQVQMVPVDLAYPVHRHPVMYPEIKDLMHPDAAL